MLKLFRLLKPYIPAVAAVFFLTFFQVISELYLPTLMSDIIDNGIVNADTGYILTVGGRMLAIAVLGTVCAGCASLLTSRTAAGFGKILRNGVFVRVESFSLQEFERFGTASLITRTTNDIMQMQQVVIMMMRLMLRAPMMCIGGIIMAVSKDPVLSLVIFFAIPLLVLVITAVTRKGMPLFRAMQLKLDGLNRVLRERLTGIRVIRAFNRTDYENKRFNGANLDLTKTAERVNKLMAVLMPVMMLILNYTIIAIIWFGSMRIDQGYMQVGDLMAFIQYVGHIMFSMLMLSMIFVIIPRASVSAARINEVLETESRIEELLYSDSTASTGAAGTGEAAGTGFSAAAGAAGKDSTATAGAAACTGPTAAASEAAADTGSTATALKAAGSGSTATTDGTAAVITGTGSDNSAETGDSPSIHSVSSSAAGSSHSNRTDGEHITGTAITGHAPAGEDVDGSSDNGAGADDSKSGASTSIDVSASACTATDTDIFDKSAGAETDLASVSVKTDICPGSADTLDKKGYVQFENVTFSYPGAERPAVSGVSFCAKPGEVTAVIGGTGSGKSTLLKLILRFYDVDSGRILVDNKDIRELPLQVLRAKIGYVPQKSVLFTGTIADNLRYGKDDASEEELKIAVEIAQAGEFVSNLADGMDSLIEQGGINVSGGQKQRLSIARALIRKPQIYIFDDCFSALDFKTDARLRKALKSETSNSTMIIVAQRVSTVIDADQIIVLDQGKVVGIGRHRELLDSCRVYREIVSSQMLLEELA